MSLRVLLADESASIRKVFQMGLQDFGAEVKSVHNGLDVIEVAEVYQPHIIFADILLQKKNGYEVSRELGQHEALNQIPIILMWSSFMELDQTKYKSCGAHGELEKPFDVEAMRALIQDLVTHTKSQQISQFLEFPDNIKNAFVEDERAQNKQEPAPQFKSSVPETPLSLENSFHSTREAPEVEPPEGPLYSAPEESSIFNLQSEDPDFSDSLSDEHIAPIIEESPVETSEGESWTAKPLSDQSIEPQTKTQLDPDLDQFQSMNLQNKDKLNLNDFLYRPDPGMTPPPEPKMENTDAGKIAHVQITPEHTAGVASTETKVSAAEAEHIIRQETRDIIKQAIAEQLPKILEKVVREELHKVLEQEMELKASSKNL